MNWPDFTVEGGSIAAGLLAMSLAVATIIVGIWVTYVTYRGYRQSDDQPTLFLAVGIALAFAVHTFARIVFPTVGASSPLTDTAAVAIQIVGLGFILYAVYGRPEHADVRILGGVVLGGVFVFLAPIIAVERTVVDPTTAQDGVNAFAALVGGFVATQAYRGYRRYDSRPMLLLAAGLLLLTVGSFVGAIVVSTFSTASDAEVLAVVGGSELAGLVLVLRSLTQD
ncbi:hypothetical protein SAMN05444422_109198 [Halobiforma haloterrestris]|uniref:Uncharacterized protein n=1 Tax=Natronobacterium haloterrestre TaxID=148448 RepID=A0A1I1JTL7_NATHA|nr:hypothetical protein [Halobiforma haloterrestris]SFC51914.1 hypothetical protein SAMN05444422_109198 [Halobiforma haloterrestris]